MVKRFFAGMTFKKKLFYYSLAISIIPVLLLGTVSSWVSSNAVQEEVNLNHRIILKQVQGKVDQILHSLDKASLQIATHLSVVKSVEVGPSVQYFDETSDMIHTLHLQKNLSDIDYEASLVFNRYDKVYSTSSGLIDQKDFPYRDLLKSNPISYNSTVFIPPGTYPDQQELLLLRPVPVVFDEVANGIIILHLDAAGLTDLLNDVQLGNDRKLFILDAQGIVIAGQTSQDIGERLATSAQLYDIWNQPEGSQRFLKVNGENYSLSLQKSERNDWSYVALIPSGQVNAQALWIKMTTWIIVGLIVILWLFVAMIGSNRIYNPVKRLQRNISGSHHADGLEEIQSFIQQTVSANDELRLKLLEQQPHMRESFALKVMKGELTGNEIVQLAEQHQVVLRSNDVATLLIDMDRFYYFQQQYNEKDRSLLQYALRKIVEEILESRQLTLLLCAPMTGQLALAAAFPEHDRDALQREVIRAANTILDQVRQYFTFTVTVSVSFTNQGLTGIPASYREASERLTYRLLLGDNRLITEADIQPAIQQSKSVLVQWQKQIVSHLVHGQQDEAESLLDEMIQSLPQFTSNTEAVFGSFAYLLGEIEYLRANAMDASRSSDSDSAALELSVWDADPYKQLYGMNTLGQIAEWLKDEIFPQTIALLGSMDKQRRLVQQVLLAIEHNLHTELSLQWLADEMNVPHYQLSRAFKEQTGVNFSDYVIQLKMDRAKEWLTQTDMELKEMAEKLSYASVQNFSRIFKQVAGVPPGQYRKQHKLK